MLTNGIHARDTMEPPMVKSASNDLNVDGAIAKTDDFSALGKYLDKLIHELEDMDNWVKDESLDIMTSLISHKHWDIHWNNLKYERNRKPCEF